MSISVAAQLRKENRENWFEPEIEQLLRTTLDDLVKYNIVRLLREHPTMLGNDMFFASALGFHSRPRTREALEMLADAGILQKWAGSREEDTAYGLTADQIIRQRLDLVFAIKPESQIYGELLRRLAARSLQRAERYHKHKKEHLTGTM